MNTKYNKVDFHVHYLTPTYREFLMKHFGAFPEGFPTPDWSIESQLKSMDENNIVYSLLGMSSPYFSSTDDDKIKIAVEKNNNEISEMLKGYEDKLGFLAALPLPNIENSLKEIDRALELGAKGFTVNTHSGDVYLGNPKLDLVMEKLNDKKAIVAIHPTEATAIPKDVCVGLPIPAMEFFVDTTRTFVNMSQKNLFKRYPNIKWIVPHAGAFLPVLSDRVQIFFNRFKTCPNIFDDLKHVYFDTAGYLEPKLLEILLKVAPINHILYGSDYPHTPLTSVKRLAKTLENTNKLNEQEKELVFHKNALKLLPFLEL